MDGNGVWGRDLGMKGKRETGKNAKRYLKWMMGVGWRVPGYMIRKELQRDKLRGRVGRRVWGYKKRLAEDRKSKLARRCWEEIRERAKRERGELINMKKAKTEFF